MNHLRRWILFAGIGLLMAAPRTLAEEPAAVAGSVRVNGKPLAGGRIFFHLGNGQFLGARVVDGNYRVERLPVGKLIVTVEFKGVPARFADEKQSGLFYEAAKGLGAYDVELKYK